MAADAVQHVVGRIVMGSSGHCERKEAEDPRLLVLFQAGWIYQAACAEMASPRLLFPWRGRGGLRAADQSESGTAPSQGRGGAKEPDWPLGWMPGSWLHSPPPTRVQPSHRGGTRGLLGGRLHAVGEAAEKSH